MQAGVVQFVKGRSDTGEEAFFRSQPGVSWHVMGDGFTWDTQNRAADIASAREGQQVPIVAMTANAFAEDRAQCMAAG
jgi:cob(I)alamin adenosyltransferase